MIIGSQNASHHIPKLHKFMMAINLLAIDVQTNQILGEHPKINQPRVQLQRTMFVIFNIHQL